jgi:hypothetical protein
MTTDASVTQMDAKAAYPRPPRTIRLALIAAFVTAVLAGPVTMTLFLSGQAAAGGLPFRVAAERLAELLMYSTFVGLIGSIPAAIINTLLLAFLARRRRDASGFAIASGLTLGVLIAGTLVTLVFLDEGWLGGDDGQRFLSYLLNLGLPFLVAGGLMGALHWRIAIRPRRRWRLFQERERAALLAME